MKKISLLFVALMLLGGCSFVTSDHEIDNSDAQKQVDVEQKSNENKTQDVEKLPDVSTTNETVESSTPVLEPSFDGDWLATVPDTLNGQDGETSVTMVLIIEKNGHVMADIEALLSTDMAPAARILSVQGDGYIAEEMVAPYWIEGYEDQESIILDWEGDRDDIGRAVIVYNKKDDTLIWSSHIFESTDYTLPADLVFHR